MLAQNSQCTDYDEPDQISQENRQNEWSFLGRRRGSRYIEMIGTCISRHKIVLSIHFWGNVYRNEVN